MEQVRCTNCGSTAIIPDGTGEFCTCEACGSTFSVKKASAFSKVTLDHTQDIRAWREYLAKQLRLQQESAKARDYAGVRLFAQKILSVLPDDFCAQYYVALADRYSEVDAGYIDFLKNVSLDGVTADEKREVAESLCATAEPRYADDIRKFLARAFPAAPTAFEDALDRSLKLYIQKLKYSKVSDRDVFICHRTAAPDQDIADAICTRLEERGLRCWIAPRNILAGSQNYDRDILKGVENSRLFLLVSSFKSIYSEDCEMELKAAVLADKALYSYRIDDTPYDGTFEKALGSVQWLDASDDPYAHLEQLVIDVKGILAEDEREKAELEEKRLAAREKERIMAEARRSEEQERIDRLEKIVSSGVAASGAAQANVRTRLKRAEIEMQSGNYERAQKIIDEALDCDPENGYGWWLLLLNDYHVASDDELIKTGKDYTAHRYYKNAERFADPLFAKRLSRVDGEFVNGAVKSAISALDRVELCMSRDDFDGMKDELKALEPTFADEGGLVFSKFPDVASRFYWYKLWVKYGQTHLVCIEDITRENEYALAMRYASPAQKKTYEAAREIVSKNAQLFLRERSKNRFNDSKLTDYLIDNKNILPIEVYNYYSSMMYFRKMLSQLNVTEAQLRTVTTDITTNEYFLLAQSLATDEQKKSYDEIVAQIEDNRRARRRKEQDIYSRQLEAKERAAAADRCKTTVLKALFAITFVLSWLTLIGFIAVLQSEHLMHFAFVLLPVSVTMRIANDIINMISGDASACRGCGLLNGVIDLGLIIYIGSSQTTELVAIIGPCVTSLILSIITVAMSAKFRERS